MVALAAWHDDKGVFEVVVCLDAIYPRFDVRIASIEHKGYAVDVFSSWVWGKRELYHKATCKTQDYENECYNSEGPAENTAVFSLCSHVIFLLVSSLLLEAKCPSTQR